VLRNCLAAALRSLARSRVYSAISVFGLALGLCAAILAGLIVRNETSYDHYLPDFERLYLAGALLIPTGHPGLYTHDTPSWIAAPMQQRFPAVEAVTRVALQEVKLKHERVEAQKEKIYWADPNVFDLLRFPTLAGDLQSALQRPDSIVITRSVARKYFGRDTPLGESLLVGDEHPMTVTAVIEDLPVQGSQFETAVFASGVSSYSELTRLANDPLERPDSTRILVDVRTYFRLAPGASLPALREAMPEFFNSLRPPRLMPAGTRFTLNLVRIDQVHLSPDLNHGVQSRLMLVVLIGALILVIAAVNFVNLTTARAARRALEVGVRKVAGAGRLPLVIQFLGEALIYTLAATALAVMGVELLLPAVNSFLQTGAVFAWWREPLQIAWIALGALLLALIAGSYPAFLLSGFRPVAVLKARVSKPAGNVLRMLLVGAQFAILIGLVIAAGVVYEQRQYATHEALRVDTDQVLIIRTNCLPALEDRLRAIDGVRGVACAAPSLLTGESFGNYTLKDGSVSALDINPVEPGALDMLGLQPQAGRFPLPLKNEPPGLVVNESAARRFGFPTDAAAIGQFPPVTNEPAMAGTPIVAVVRDFNIDAINQTIRPTVYTPMQIATRGFRTDNGALVNVKLNGRDIPQTLVAIDRVLTAANPTETIDRQFLDTYVQNLYVAVQRQEQALAISAAVAVIIACLGLVGLSASLAERRTKEIGIRKAMGANTVDILRMLLWQFTQPVLASIAVAWLVSGLLMNRWLHGFAEHVALDPGLMVTAAVAGLVIALATVSMHCYLIARAHPVAALRYE
jgi:putative ABC transport system permease protein